MFFAGSLKALCIDFGFEICGHVQDDNTWKQHKRLLCDNSVLICKTNDTWSGQSPYLTVQHWYKLLSYVFHVLVFANSALGKICGHHVDTHAGRTQSQIMWTPFLDNYTGECIWFDKSCCWRYESHCLVLSVSKQTFNGFNIDTSLNVRKIIPRFACKVSP